MENKTVETIKMGTLYLNHAPRTPGSFYDKGEISIGYTVAEKELQWVKLKSGLLIGDRCACVNIDWTQLNEHGLVFGKVVDIDGRHYLCRSLKVGDRKGAPNEWDAALDEVGEDNDIWHWNGTFFWGQKHPKGDIGCRVYRGHRAPRYRAENLATLRGSGLGFRPALEPLARVPLDFGSMIGTTITPLGPDSSFVSGKLVSVSDYDLVLEPATPISTTCKWVVKEGKFAVVDRASISWLREA